VTETLADVTGIELDPPLPAVYCECGHRIGMEVVRDGVLCLAVGGLLARSVSGYCGCCGEPFSWRSARKITKGRGMMVTEP